MRLGRLKEELSDKLKTASKVGRAIGYGAFLGLAWYTVGCSTTVRRPEINLPEGTPYTITYQDNGRKRTVWDLTGCWNATKNTKDFGQINIQQKNNYFKAINSNPNEARGLTNTPDGEFYAKKGEIAFEGHVSDGHIKSALIHTYRGSYSFEGQIAKDSSAFSFSAVMPGGYRNFEILEFKRCESKTAKTSLEN